VSGYLVGSAAFKAVGTSEPRPAGSIPVHLRHVSVPSDGKGVVMLFPIRKILTVVEEIHHDLGPAPQTPALKGAVAAVVGNPYVGRWVDDLSPAVDELRALGERLGNVLIGHLGGDPSRIDGYGKGTIVGSAGDAWDWCSLMERQRHSH